MIIKYGNTDITDLLLEYKRKGSINQENIFLLGNTPSYELDLRLDNSSHLLETLSGYIQEFDDENILKGTYLVYEAPQKFTDVVDLICFDLMSLTNISYDTKLQYPTTVLNQLNEIATLTTVTIATSTIPQDVLTQEVNFWDNTVSCRDYIGWIAEVSGMNAFCNSKGEIIFKQLSKIFDYETNDVEDYSKDELFTVSRVCFDNGLLKLEQGTTDGNTLYLSSNNPYIDNEHDPIARIYQLYNGWSVTNFEKMKAAGLDGLKLMDVVLFNGYKFLCLDFDSVYHGGEFQIQNLKGKLTTKNAEKTMLRYNDDIRMKMIKIIVDQNKGQLNIVSQKQEGQEKRLSNLELDNDNFKISIETQNNEISKIKHDVSNEIIDSTNELEEHLLEVINKTNTSIDVTKQEILLGVNNIYATKDGVDSEINSIKSTIDQTSDSIRTTFEQINSSVDGKIKDAKFKYITENMNGITISMGGSSISTNIDNDSMTILNSENDEQFKATSTDVEIKRIIIKDSLFIGNIVITPRPNGSVGLRKRSDTSALILNEGGNK